MKNHLHKILDTPFFDILETLINNGPEQFREVLRILLNPPVGGFLIRLLTDECNWVHSPPLVENPPFGVAAK